MEYRVGKEVLQYLMLSLGVGKVRGLKQADVVTISRILNVA